MVARNFILLLLNFFRLRLHGSSLNEEMFQTLNSHVRVRTHLGAHATSHGSRVNAFPLPPLPSIHKYRVNPLLHTTHT